jgi:hypothetical protein
LGFEHGFHQGNDICSLFFHLGPAHTSCGGLGMYCGWNCCYISCVCLFSFCA